MKQLIEMDILLFTLKKRLANLSLNEKLDLYTEFVIIKDIELIIMQEQINEL